MKAIVCILLLMVLVGCGGNEVSTFAPVPPSTISNKTYAVDDRTININETLYGVKQLTYESAEGLTEIHPEGFKSKKYGFKFKNVLNGKIEFKAKVYPEENEEYGEGNTIYLESFYGNSNIIKFIPNEGYRLAFILHNGFYFRLQGNEYTFYVTRTEQIIEPVFIPEDACYSAFIGEECKLLDYFINQEYITDLTIYTKYQKEFQGFELKEVDVDREYYQKSIDAKETACSVDVENGTTDKEEYKYGDIVTVTATNDTRTGFFKCWKRDGFIASYDKEYSFTVYDDTVLEAVFDRSISIPGQAVFLSKRAFLADDLQMELMLQVEKLNGKKPISQGIIYAPELTELSFEFCYEALYFNSVNEYVCSVPIKNGYYQAFSVYKEIFKEDGLDKTKYYVYYSNVLSFN